MKWKIEYRTIILKEKSGEYITTPGHVAEALTEVFSPISEEFYLLIMDTKNQIIEKHLVCKGNYNTLHIAPAEIFRSLLMNGGKNFIIAHNHPSGDSEPSEEDIIMTRKIKNAAEILGVCLLDHIIYTGDEKNYYSFKKNDLL